MVDVCERLSYKYYEVGDIIVNEDKTMDKCFILLDGTVEFKLDLMNPYLLDMHFVEISNSCSLEQNKIIKNVRDYKIKNDLTKDKIIKKQLNQLILHKISNMHNLTFKKINI